MAVDTMLICFLYAKEYNEDHSPGVPVPQLLEDIAGEYQKDDDDKKDDVEVKMEHTGAAAMRASETVPPS